MRFLHNNNRIPKNCFLILYHRLSSPPRTKIHYLQVPLSPDQCSHLQLALPVPVTIAHVRFACEVAQCSLLTTSIF